MENKKVKLKKPGHPISILVILKDAKGKELAKLYVPTNKRYAASRKLIDNLVVETILSC